MSYDVDINGKWFNYTYNMHQFFKDFGAYPNDWEGVNYVVVARQIRSALKAIAREPLAELKAKYDAPNGWGTVEGAIEFLTGIAEAGELKRSNKVHVS